MHMKLKPRMLRWLLLLYQSTTKRFYDQRKFTLFYNRQLLILRLQFHFEKCFAFTLTKPRHLYPSSALLLLYYALSHPHLSFRLPIWSSTYPTYIQKLQRFGGVPRNLKRGGRNFLFPFSLKISVKTKKKSLHVFRRPIYPPKSSEDQKKGHRILRCLVLTVSLTGDIYQLTVYFSGEGGAATPAAPLNCRIKSSA